MLSSRWSAPALLLAAWLGSALAAHAQTSFVESESIPMLPWWGTLLLIGLVILLASRFLKRGPRGPD